MSYNSNVRSRKRPSAFGRPRSGAPSRGPARSTRRGPKKDYISPDRFIKQARIVEREVYVPQYTFSDFAVVDLIKQNLTNKGFTAPSSIQDQTIPLALDGRDIIGIADTGTGKTAAFAIPVLHAAMTRDAHVLVIAPTRELAQQIDAEFRTIGRGSNLRSAVLIGGAAMGIQLRQLREQPQIVIGTPGRIKDHMQRGTLRLNNFQFAVLDEVDRMLDIGFVNDVQEILAALNPDRQSFYFSATMDDRVKTLIETFSNNPAVVSVKTGETGENIHQDVVRVSHQGAKLDALHDLLIEGKIQKAIIFDDTQRAVERLSIELLERGFKADAIHGGKSQGQRQRSLNKFKQNEVNILVATDVAARGIDVADITHVINYSTPNSYADYVHRIGRAGRAGRVGYALTFIEQ